MERLDISKNIMNEIREYRSKIITLIVLSIFISVDRYLAQDTKNEIIILLMGDNNFQMRDKPEDAFKYLIPLFNEADIKFLNLEGAFAGGTDDPDKRDIPHKNWRHSNPDQVRALTAAGIDVVGVANNVTYPWQALMKSLNVLDSAGIQYTGGGKNIYEAHKPVIIAKDGLKIGFIQYAATVFPTNHAALKNQPGIAQIKVHTSYQAPKNLDKPGQPPIVITILDEESKSLMVNDIKKIKNEADLVIASYHWGISGSTEAISYQKDIAKLAIDAGADLVFGHGPHKYQEITSYRGKIIFYSLGQQVFDDRRLNRWKNHKEGLIVKVIVKEKKIDKISLLPTWREDDNFVRIYDPNIGKGKELFESLKIISKDGPKLQIQNKEISVELNN